MATEQDQPIRGLIGLDNGEIIHPDDELLARVAERARHKSKPEPMPEEPRTEEPTGEAVLWAASPVKRLVQLKPVDGRAPIVVGFDTIKIIAATILSMEAQAEQHGIPFPRFEVSNPEAAAAMPPGVGRVPNPFDGNGIKAR